VVPQFTCYELEFDINRAFDNPYDPDEIDVQIDLVTPDDQRLTHPGFWELPHQCVLDHGREVVRRAGEGCWKVRVSPTAIGRHRWRLKAICKDSCASCEGQFICVRSDGPGFVRVSTADPCCLEFSDGSYFFPIGHCTRSPVDDRWRTSTPGSDALAERYAAEGTFAYAKWFAKMHESDENFCSIWMTPWWCGLEWTPTLRGYAGVGHYNQRNASQLDRLVRLAEENGVYILLYTMNHGMLSSVIDPEWHKNPYNRSNGGTLEFASAFFESAEARRLHRNYLRYLVARWGYSPAIAIWGVTTEIDWLEAYQGERGVSQVVNAEGRAESVQIQARPGLVVRWLNESAEYLKAMDAHRHVVSAQVCYPTRGDDVWSSRNMELVLSNAYTSYMADTAWQGEHFVGTQGVADAVFIFSKSVESRRKPGLIAEWGGGALHNVPSQLATELHTGLWTSYMTNLAGVTGFWWWNTIDMDNLYSTFGALARFNAGEDRRGKDYRSERARVLIEFSPFSKGETPVFAPHPREMAVVLFDGRSLRGYVYCHEINDPKYSRPSAGFEDSTFPESGSCSLALPDGLSAGRYRVEFWNTFKGEPFETTEVTIAEGVDRMLRLPPHRVDLAWKVDRLDE
jgi:hypothetical protein